MKLIALGHCMGAPEVFKDLFKEIIAFPVNSYDTVEKVVGLHQRGEIFTVMFGGGEDISPNLYTQSPSKFNYGAWPKSSLRDTIESEVAVQLPYYKIPSIGICRGAQMLWCTLERGRLFQHVNGHSGDHEIITNSGETLVTSSAHHQMIDYSSGREGLYSVIAKTKEPRSSIYVQDDETIYKHIKIEPEILISNPRLSVLIQGHPEFMSDKSGFVQYCKELIDKTILKAPARKESPSKLKPKKEVIFNPQAFAEELVNLRGRNAAQRTPILDEEDR